LGGATASDIIRVIEHVRATVAAAYGVKLELEVRIVDAWGRVMDPGGPVR
ncbi:hypothetical protein JXA80_02950, partial [bacterium]|nr:hypothetical protein [candidate division CSSED10-310 bacterium]